MEHACPCVWGAVRACPLQASFFTCTQNISQRALCQRRQSRVLKQMPTIAAGVDFNVIAREWRMKWSTDNDKKSLADAQAALGSVLANVKAVPGVQSVQRVVCGGCLDFKVIVALSAETFGDWESSSFAPEAEFLAHVKAIAGISHIETQTYTLMTM